MVAGTVLSARQEQLRLALELRRQQRSWTEVADAFRERYGVNARVAPRLARGWSQRQAADHWNERWPADPKTFKNFSYWENWPSRTGYAPSLDVLAKLAELYECHVADLLADFSDFRHRDTAHLARRRLAAVATLTNGAAHAGAPRLPPVELSADPGYLRDIDVHELAQLGSAWAEQLDADLDRRALLLKLSAGLALAAATPELAIAAPAESIDPPVDRESFAGIWRSQYTYYSYYSTGRRSRFQADHYVVLRHQAGRIIGQSLPHTLDSRLRLDMTVVGSIATGTWSERTSPTGYYAGVTYHGTLQLLVDSTGRTMTGKWLGFGKDSKVNTGRWDMTWVTGATSKRAMREYHLKA